MEEGKVVVEGKWEKVQVMVAEVEVGGGKVLVKVEVSGEQVEGAMQGLSDMGKGKSGIRW